jgi:hypothetical protein
MLFHSWRRVSSCVAESAPRRRLVMLFFAVAIGLSPVSGGPLGDRAEAATKNAKNAKTAKTTKTAKPAKKTVKKKVEPKITLGAVRKTKAERDRIRANRAKQARSLNTVKATKAEAARALEALNAKVRVTDGALSKAQQRAARAKRELADTERRLATLESKLQGLQTLQLRGALEAFTTPVSDSVDGFLNSETASEVGRRQVLSDLANRNQAGVLDELGALREDLGIEQDRAAAARKRTQTEQEAVADRLKDFKEARADQERISQALEDRLERELAESASLAELDSALSAKLAKQNDALARQLAASAGAGGRGSGSFRVGDAREVATVGGGDTHGIRVAASIRGDLVRMLAAAKADGVYLTGGGYRSPANQIRLRAAHCGSSTYAIWHMRSSQCRPPTARPGQSQHERGLAIDFSEGRGALTRNSAGYRWLKANAWRYGFKNLPSEAWHWSRNGR